MKSVGKGRRKFDLYTISTSDVELFGAWDGKKKITFTYADSLHFRMIRKSNTQLFDALTDICGMPYQLSMDILQDLLYELIVVELRTELETPCIRVCGEGPAAVGEAESLVRAMYDCGFSITEIPDGAEKRAVHFVPLIAPASMARKGQYLFVNAKRLDPLLRALTLDMIHGSADLVPVTAEGLGKRAFISVHKLAAYIGNAYSDGRSLRELVEADADDGAIRLGLHAGNTVCVADVPSLRGEERFAYSRRNGLDRFDYYWASKEAERETSLPLLTETVVRSEPEQELEKLFRALNDPKEDFKACIPAPDSGIWEAWKAQITAFFRTSPRPSMKLEAVLMPVPERGKEPIDLMRYGVVYAAIMADTGRPCIYQGTEEAAETEEDLCLSWNRLLQAVENSRTKHERLYLLWNAAHTVREQTDFAEGLSCHWQAAGLYVQRMQVPTRYYRAELRRLQEDEAVETTLYDGLGFLADAQFAQLEKLLGLEKNRLNAVQVRLPWCKGLLVRFSFTEFFADWAQQQGIALPELRLRDTFGQERRIFDDQGQPVLSALFTESMFKGAGWFRALEMEGDRWAEYWQRLEAHGMALLIVGQNSPVRQESRLNYQFVATGGMDAEMLAGMARQRLMEIREAQDSPEAMAKLLQYVKPEEPEDEEPVEGAPGKTDAAVEDPDREYDGEEEAAEDYSACMAVAATSRGAALCRTGFVQRRVKALADSETVELMRGRLPVEGDMRYALPDLMEMCRDLARYHLLPRGRRPEKPVQRLNAPGDQHVHGWYYAPGRNAPWMQGSRRAVAVLRNPHYAAGEEPVLQPLPDTEQEAYDRYFRRLTGCIMLPSAALMTLNGADCDGDRVNVCSDERVLKGLERQATRENDVLRAMIARKDEMQTFLREKAESAGKGERQTYLLTLKDALDGILPQAVTSDAPMGCCAPLMYSGSVIFRQSANGKKQEGTAKFRADALRGSHLARQMWEAFQHSGDQEIGRMSLHLLDLTAVAYRENGATPAMEMAAEELLAAFMPRYLVIQSALDTAMEIDMAKSGLRRADCPLKQPPEQLYGMLGLRGGESSYRQWQTLYKQRHGSLSGKEFDKNLKKLMDDYGQKRRKAEMGDLPLESLPEVVFGLWQERKKGRAAVQSQRLGMVLTDPRWPEGADAETCEKRSQALAIEMQRKTNVYQQCLRQRSDAESEHIALAKKHVLALRWLLGAGYPLHTAHEALDDIRAMLAEWQTLCGNGRKYRDAVNTISKRLDPEQTAAAWGWGDEAHRQEMLEELLTVGKRVLPCKAALRKKITAHPRGILLLKHIIRYAQTEMKLLSDPGTETAYTPDALERWLQRLAEKEEGDPVLRQELFYAACRLLNMGAFHTDGSYKTGKAVKAVLNDFLTTYLLRNELAERLPARMNGY